MNQVQSIPKTTGITTPWGFCISNGTITSGIGVKEFFWNGWLIGDIFLLSQFLMIQLVQALLPFFPSTWAEKLLFFQHAPHGNPLFFLLYALSIRFSPAAGLHAAEHMAINALDSGLPLTRALVANQSRVDKRCGTAFVLTFFGVGLILYFGQLLSLWMAPWLALLIMGVCLLLFYRYFTPLNFWFQEHIFTASPSPEQLESAFQSACDLAVGMEDSPQIQPLGFWPQHLNRSYSLVIGPIVSLSLAYYWHWVY